MTETMLFMSANELSLLSDIARIGSFAAVGRKRDCVAYAVSDGLNALEATVGFQLIDRNTRPLSLTEAGQRFLYHAEERLKEEDWTPGYALSLYVGPMERFLRQEPWAPRIIPVVDASAYGPKPKVSSKQSAVPDGEFFIVSDMRQGGESLSIRRQYDPDPQETEAIKARRMAYYRTFEPDWTPYESHDLFHQRYPGRYPTLPPIMPDMVHKSSGFKRPKPKRGPDELLKFPILDQATLGPSGSHFNFEYYLLVSSEWKAAVESLEPGVHEFFAHDVIFSDGIWPRYIFRDRQDIDCLDQEAREPTTFDISRGRYTIQAKRAALAGRHWVRQSGWYYNFVSRDLALLLLPLLPRLVKFMPIEVVD